jgi:phage terminase large subunit-like protein
LGTSQQLTGKHVLPRINAVPETVVRPPSHPKINAYEVALKYANDVISGQIVAGKLIKLAAKRFLRDLKFGHERGLRFDKDAAQHVVDFFGFLRHSKGEWGAQGGQIFILQPWQVFILANLFGWLRADGTRRFREAYIEVARKNGKSTFIAGIGLYMLLADGEPGAEIYSAATKKDQAKIVFEEAVRMRSKSPFLSSRINAPRGNLHVLETASKFEPLSADDNTLDGLNIHCALIDELHAHPNRLLYDVLYEATKARRQPLCLAITTAGYNRQGIAYKQREIGENILVGNVEAAKGDAFFAFIACMDEKDAQGQPLRWNDERNWAMANPNLGISVKLDALREAAAKAEQDPTSLNSFLRKHLNVWTSQDVRWMPPHKWAACNGAGPLISPKELRAAAFDKLKGRLCYGGIDLSSKIDLSAFVLVFPPVKELRTRRAKPQTQQDIYQRKPVEFEEIIVKEGDPKWHILPWFFVPKDNITERVAKDRVEYDVWEREGFITATKGNAIDQQTIRSTVNAARGMFLIEEIGFDSWNATALSNELIEDGHKLVEVRQGYKTMSEPMKELMALVLSKDVEHYGNPVLSWCATNVAAEQDPAGNVKPDKEHSKEKIDGIVATIMALHRVVQNPNASSQNSVYNQRGIIFI